jgi:hypothetical protein
MEGRPSNQMDDEYRDTFSPKNSSASEEEEQPFQSLLPAYPSIDISKCLSTLQ